MGAIKKVLAEEVLEPRSVTPNGLWVDLCENIHIHFRNLRLDMSIEEFSKFMAGMHNLYKAAEHTIEQSDFKEGDPNILKQLMFQESFSHSSAYYPNRLSVEWNKDDTYHVHYRDLRIHLSQDEFEDFERAFTEAKRLRSEYLPFAKKYGPFKEAKVMPVDIDDVQPYDAGHKPGGMCLDPVKDDATRDHEEGIEKVMALIEKGEKILPILVGPDGQRLDGYKRYMAFKRLGHKQIEVMIDPNGKMGGQDGQSWLEPREEVMPHERKQA